MSVETRRHRWATRRHRWATRLKGALRSAEPSPQGPAAAHAQGWGEAGAGGEKKKVPLRGQAAAGPGSVRAEENGKSQGVQAGIRDTKGDSSPSCPAVPWLSRYRRDPGAGVGGGERAGERQGQGEELGKAWENPRRRWSGGGGSARATV